MVDAHIKIPTRTGGVLAQQSGAISLLNGAVQTFALMDEFAANIDIADPGTHGATGQQATLNQFVRLVAQNIAVLAGARLGFIGIDDQIMRRVFSTGIRRHEGPFQPGRETRAAASAQAGLFDLVDNPLAPFAQQRAGLAPIAAPARRFEACILEAVQIGEYAILVLQHDSATQISDPIVAGLLPARRHRSAARKNGGRHGSRKTLFRRRADATTGRETRRHPNPRGNRR